MGRVTPARATEGHTSAVNRESADALLLYTTAIENNLRRLNACSRPLRDALVRLETLLEHARAELTPDSAGHG
jgi:hypothetical protein